MSTGRHKCPRKNWTYIRFSDTSRVPICSEVTFICMVDLHTHLFFFFIFTFDLWSVIILGSLGHEKRENACNEAARCKGDEKPGESIGVWKVKWKCIKKITIPWFCEPYFVCLNCIYFVCLNCRILSRGSINIYLLPDSSDMITALRNDKTAYAIVSENPGR